MQVVHCIENGLPLLIEGLPEEIDAVLEPVIQKKVRNHGGSNPDAHTWGAREVHMGCMKGCPETVGASAAVSRL